MKIGKDTGKERVGPWKWGVGLWSNSDVTKKFELSNSPELPLGNKQESNFS